MKKRQMGELFEVFSDPRPSGAAAIRGRTRVGEGFRKFLEDRGEYPFKDDNDPSGKSRVGRIFRIRMETILVVALAFLIVNIASFSVGVWNGKRGTVRAEEPSADGRETSPRKLGDVTSPKVIVDQVPKKASKPVPAPAFKVPKHKPSVQPVSSPIRGKYTIRVASLGLGQAKEAREIADFFAGRGYKPAQVRKIQSNLVIEVGAFPSTKSPQAVRALKDVKRARCKYTRFQDAFFVRK